MRRIALIAASLLGLVLSACEQNLEKANFNAYFYYPDNREEYLGLVQGLSACQTAARSRAETLNMSNAQWSYICCEKTSSSDCATKHK
jgi:hypothetical protein